MKLTFFLQRRPLPLFRLMASFSTTTHPLPSASSSAASSSSSSSASSSFNRLVVQKYGGTSLGTPEKLEKVLNILQSWTAKSRVILVVSALSSGTKEEGTTSRLLAAAYSAVKNQEFQHYLDKIEDTHLDVIYRMLKNRSIREEVRNYVVSELKIVRTFCECLTVIRELSPRSHDMIVGCGERLSAGVIAGVLKDHNIASTAINLSNIFPDGLDPLKPGYHILAQKQIHAAINPSFTSNPTVVPVVTGFLGHVLGGIVEGVGRGYSDLTAALTAAAFKAEALQVWKESDGVFTGNPTKLPKARLLHYVTPREAAELTYFGNEVLHPFTMECAMEANIPIHILNTFKPTSEGTIIDPEIKVDETKLSKGIVAVCSKKNITILSLSSNRLLGSATFLAKVFELFAKHKVKVDLISTTEANLSLTIHESVPISRINALAEELNPLGLCTLLRDRAIVSCIGEGMKHRVGLAAQMFGCLSEGGINFEMITQGASEINMSVVIEQAYVDKAVSLIHARFLEAPSSTDRGAK